MSEENNYWKTFANEDSLQENLYNTTLFVTWAFNYFAFISVLFQAIPLLCQVKILFCWSFTKNKRNNKDFNPLKQNISLQVISYRLMDLEQMKY